jgi:hypothetical protein
MAWLRRLAADNRVSPFAVRIAVALTRWFNDENKTFPSHATLGSRAGGKQAGARTALRNLEETGYLKVERVGRRATNRYRPSLPGDGDGCGDNSHLDGDGCADNSHLDGDGCADNSHLDGDGCGHNGVMVVATTTIPLLISHKKDAGARTAFRDQASAVAAVIEAAGLGEGDAAILRACSFNAEAQRLIARSETALISIRAAAGEAMEGLGLRLACGAFR